MTSNFYRYTLGSSVSMQDVQDSLLLAVLAVECLHGSAKTRLELIHHLDSKSRICVINATTEVGQDVARLFTGFLQREFGQDSFTVQKVDAPTTAKCTPSQN